MKDSVTSTYLYDARDHLREITVGGSTVGQFLYDAQGLRIEKIGDRGTERYAVHGRTSAAGAGSARAATYDDQSVLLQLLQTDDTGSTIAKYEYGPDRLLSLNHSTEGRQYYLTDALQSVVNLANADGSIQARYQYDAWGNKRSEIGSSWNRFSFTGYEEDTESGLLYAKARYYDPDIGLFTSQDAWEGDLNIPPSLNKYLYAYGNPTVWVDLTGNEPALALETTKQVVTNVAPKLTTVTPEVAANTAATSSSLLRTNILGLSVGSAIYGPSGAIQEALNNEASNARVERIDIGDGQFADVYVTGRLSANQKAKIRFDERERRGLSNPNFDLDLDLGSSDLFRTHQDRPGELLDTFDFVRALISAENNEGNKIEISVEAEGRPGNAGIPTIFSDEGDGTDSSDALQDGGGKKRNQVIANKKAGDDFKDKVKKLLEKNRRFVDVEEEVTLESKSKTPTRMDLIAVDKDGNIQCFECKASEKAPLTKNQKITHPELEIYGGVVKGKGKPGIVGGTELKPVKVKVVRPDNLKDLEDENGD